ncbi:MAG: DUF4234 domain-containing protein [Clostridia bacterium]|nr:DUF4234 domain-containing protein [Clostridia bacterium]
MRKLKTDRSIIPFILLGIITCGIYNLWYMYHLVNDVNELCREDGKHSPGILTYILLSLITCGIYSFFYWFRIGDMLQVAVRKRGLNSSISGANVLICMILGYAICGIATYVGFHQIFEATNELATEYNARQSQQAFGDFNV